MKNVLFSNPLSLIVDIASSTFAAMVILVAAINCGSALAIWTFEGRWPYGLHLPMLCGIGFLHIMFACMQIWGLLYLAVLCGIIFKIQFADTLTKVRLLYLVLALQYLVALLALASFWGSTYDELADWLRLGFVTSCLLIPAAAIFVMVRMLNTDTEQVAPAYPPSSDNSI